MYQGGIHMTEEEQQTLPPIIISVEIAGEMVRRNLSDDLKVDEEHINEYLRRAPGLTAYWNTLFEKQRSITQRNKVALDRLYASKDRRYREIARADDRKPVNAEIEAEVLNDEDYINLQEEFLDNQEKELLLKGAVEAIRELRSTLISLSANMRHSGNIGVKNAEQKYRDKFRNGS